MATKKQQINPNEVINDLAVRGESAVTWEEAFEIAEGADHRTMNSLVSNYFKFGRPGDVHVFAVIGIKTTTISGEEVEVVEFQNKSRETFINGDSVFVTACKKLKELPAFVKVVYENDVKSSQGVYKNLRVFTFE